MFQDLLEMIIVVVGSTVLIEDTIANNVNALMGKAKNAKSNKTDFLKYFSFLYWGLEKNCNRKHQIIKFLLYFMLTYFVM